MNSTIFNKNCILIFVYIHIHKSLQLKMQKNIIELLWKLRGIKKRVYLDVKL